MAISRDTWGSGDGLAKHESPRDDAGGASVRLPIWRLGWLAGGLALSAAVVAGIAALAYTWLTRPTPDEAPLREANLAVVDQLADNLVLRFGVPAAALQRLVGRFAENDLGPEDTFAVSEALSATLAAAPGLQSVVYTDQDLRVVESRRDEGGIVFALRDLGNDPDAIRRLADIQAGGPGSSQWGPVVYSSEDNRLISELAVPVFRDNQPFGMLQAQVALPPAAGRVVTSGGSTPFILIGTDYVYYHPQLAPPDGGRARTATPVSELGDPALGAIADRLADAGEVADRLALPAGEILVNLRELPGPGGEPWYAGAYRPAPMMPGGITALAPLAALLGGIAVLALLIGLRWGGGPDRVLHKQAAAIDSAANLKLGAHPRLPRSGVRGIEAINHAIARLGRKVEELAGLQPGGAASEPTVAGRALETRRGMALVIWVQADMPQGGGEAPAATVAVAINAELGLIADRIELEGGAALASGNAITGVWFTSDTTNEPDARLPGDICRLADELVSIAGSGSESPARAVFSAGIAHGEVLLAKFGPPRRRRFGIVGPAAAAARDGAITAARRAEGPRVTKAEGVSELEARIAARRDADAAGSRREREAPSRISRAAGRPDQ